VRYAVRIIGPTNSCFGKVRKDPLGKHAIILKQIFRKCVVKTEGNGSGMRSQLSELRMESQRLTSKNLGWSFLETKSCLRRYEN
jgi:hypothetical protein